jgi:hypothetical protein
MNLGEEQRVIEAPAPVKEPVKVPAERPVEAEPVKTPA